MPFFSVGSIKLYYEVAGVGHPIVFLTPLLQNHVFLRQFSELFVKKYLTVNLDLLGHGLSDKPMNAELYSYENLADHCFQLVEHLNLRKHDIIGVSWSGRIALTYTLLHQENVRAVILIGSSGPKQISHIPPENSALSTEERFIVETVWKTPYDVIEHLKNIKVPTLIVIGDKDPRLEASRFMHENIPKSTLEIIKGAGHEADASVCAKIVLRWLAKLVS